MNQDVVSCIDDTWQILNHVTDDFFGTAREQNLRQTEAAYIDTVGRLPRMSSDIEMTTPVPPDGTPIADQSFRILCSRLLGR